MLMLAKHHHVNKSQRIKQDDIKSINILNETELIIYPYECSKGTTKPLQPLSFIIRCSRKKIQIQDCTRSLDSRLRCLIRPPSCICSPPLFNSLFYPLYLNTNTRLHTISQFTLTLSSPSSLVYLLSSFF